MTMLTTESLSASNALPETSSGRPERLSRLSSLRIFAAVAVVACHVGYYFTSVRVLRKAEVYGYGGVEFFFLLSGFVLTWAWLNRRPSLSKFWWKRIAKLYPITLGLMVFAYLALAPYERIPQARGKVLELTLLQAWWPSERVYFGGNGVSWSLSCEIFFYLIFPLVLPVVKRLGARGFWVLSAVTLSALLLSPLVASWSGVSEPIKYWLFFIFPPYQFGFFLLGMLMARWVAEGFRIPKPSLLFGVAVGWLGLIVVVGSQYSLQHTHGLSRPLVLLAALPAFIVLLTAAVTKDLNHRQSFLTARSLTYLGIISFELYLVHKPLFLLTRPWGIWRNQGGFEGLAVFLVFLAVVTGVAALIHHAVQIPLERFLTRAHHPIEGFRQLLRHLRVALILAVVMLAYRYSRFAEPIDQRGEGAWGRRL